MKCLSNLRDENARHTFIFKFTISLVILVRWPALGYLCVCVCVGRWVGGVGLKVEIVMRSFIIEHLIILKHDYSQ